MRKYFIHNGQSEIGPFDFEQLKTMQIKDETPIWHEALPMWTTAGDLEELKSILNSNPIPPKFENSIPPKKPFNKLILPLCFLGALILFLFFSGNIYPDKSEPTISNKETKTAVKSSVTHTDTKIKTKTKTEVSDKKKPSITELGAKNRNYRNNIKRYVRVNTNNYINYVFGGIGNLEIIVTNSTEYLLDEVNVKVDYVKENGGVYKSEIVTIYNIPAYEDKSISAPKSDRGTSVRAKIQTVSSKKMNLCYSINNIGLKTGAIDPYYCL